MYFTGRPPKYDSPEQLRECAVDYFKQFTGPENAEAVRLYGKRPTITGLVLHLGFCDRQSFYDYENRKEFSCTIKHLRTLIENVYEGNLVGPNVSGVIFALKNLGWTDKTEIEQKMSIVEMPAIQVKGLPKEFNLG